jgi:RimJ/RimL family protein N-acetyltransferase
VTLQPSLVGEGVLLRPWEPTDAVPLAREIQDPEIVRWLDIGLPYTQADAEEFVVKAPRQWEEGSAAHFVVERDGSFAGYIAALGLDGTLDAVEIVYWVAKGHRGDGVAFAALAALVGWLVESGASRIELGMTYGNGASAAVAERAGFVLREVVADAAMLDGEPADERIYELPISRSAGPPA